MDTSWCPVCSRLIPPNREQILVEVPVEDTTNTTIHPINASGQITHSTTAAAGNNHNPNTTTNKPKGSRSRTSVTATTGRSKKGQRKDSPAVAVPPPPPPPQPTTIVKQRTVLTQELGLYCSERCRLEDLHSEAAYGAGFFLLGDHDDHSWGGEGSSFTATTSTSSSAIDSRSKSPRMRNGRRA